MLLVGFGLMLALLIITCVLSWYFLNTAKEISDNVEIDDVPGAFLYLRMSKSIGNMQTNVLEYLSGETEETISDFKKEYKQFGLALAELIPLESSSATDIQKMAEIRALVDEYYTDINREVFENYDPREEQWAFSEIDRVEDTIGAELESLLDKLKEEEYDDALKAKDYQAAVTDDLPGLRYYLELLDEAGDMLSSLNEYVSGESDEVEAFFQSVESFEGYYELLLPLERKPEDLENLSRIKALYKVIVKTANDVFRRYDPLTKKVAIRRVDEMEHDVFERLELILSNSAREEQEDAIRALAELNSSIDKTIFVLIAVAIISSVTGIFIALALSSMIIAALSQVLKISDSISAGDIAHAKELLDDELHSAKLLNQFEEFEEVRVSLSKAVEELDKANQANQTQDWLKSGISELNTKLSGDLPLSEMAKNSIDFIAEYLDASIGYIYGNSQSETGLPPNLLLMAKFGAAPESGSDIARQLSFQTGEGLIGQCVRYKRVLQRKLDDAERVPVIQSGIAVANPAYITVAPLIYEGEVEGVIELGSSKELESSQVAFIEQVIPNLGIAIRVATSRDRMSQLLEQSQKQAMELERQQGMLGSSNEQLTQKTSELVEKQETLRKQNANLEQIKKDLEQQARELELSSKYKSEFLANMSHELRSPLNSLLILANLLKDNNQGNLSEKQIEYANIIHRSGQDLLAIINDILDLSKIEAGKLDMVFESFEVAEMIEVLRQNFEPIAKKQQLTFNVQDQAPGCVIISDKKRIKQVLTNLLSNSFKFTESGEVELKVIEQFEISSQSDKSMENGEVCFSVKDTGIGIEKEKVNEIFNAFCQGDGTTNRKFGGTGLGLSISKQLTELLGGYIKIESEVGIGTTMTVVIPIQRDIKEFDENKETSDPQYTHTIMPELLVNSKVNEVVKEEPEQHPDPNKTEPKDIKSDQSILIIASDAQLHAELKKQGERIGFQVVTAFDGGKGLQLAEELLPRAIILSESTPYIDGTLLLKKLKANIKTRHIPVHCVVAEKSARSQAQYMQLGAFETSFKPLETQQVSSILSQLVKQFNKEVGQILLVCEHEQLCDELEAFLDHAYLNVATCESIDDIKVQIKERVFDCVILTIDSATNNRFILDVVNALQQAGSTPLVLHSSDPISSEQQTTIEALARTHLVSPVMSKDALLVETSLFLHQISLSMPLPLRETLESRFTAHNVLEGKSLLVVDDQVNNIFALTAILETQGINCSIANNGREALELLESDCEIDLVLMDIMMPEMDGYETMKHIRKMPGFAQLPIIALTAKSMPEDREKCIVAGANDYLTKPLDPTELVNLLKIWLVTAPMEV